MQGRSDPMVARKRGVLPLKSLSSKRSACQLTNWLRTELLCGGQIELVYLFHQKEGLACGEGV